MPEHALWVVEEVVGIRERVLDGLHERPALQVDDRDLAAIEGVIDPEAAARDVVGAVVVGAQDAVVGVQEWVDLALVPDVVAARDDVDPGREHGLRGRWREAHAACHVLAVGGHEVDPALLAEPGQHALDRLAAGLADQVADHQHAACSGWPGRAPVRWVAEARPAEWSGGRLAVGPYFAYSTARVSRITVTLIWPG